ncbi:hypothetical protein [Staphylococcus phage PT1-4]
MFSIIRTPLFSAENYCIYPPRFLKRLNHQKDPIFLEKFLSDFCAILHCLKTVSGQSYNIVHNYIIFY